MGISRRWQSSVVFYSLEICNTLALTNKAVVTRIIDVECLRREMFRAVVYYLDLTRVIHFDF